MVSCRLDKTKANDGGVELLVPLSGCLSKTIQGLGEFAYEVLLPLNGIVLGKLHINFYIQISTRKSIVNVELHKLPIFLSRDK